MGEICVHSMVFLKLRLLLGEKEKGIGYSSIMPIKILDRVCMVPACVFFLFISLKHPPRCPALIYNAITIILLSTHFLPSLLVAFLTFILPCVFF